MNVIVRVVASLIATLAIFVSTSVVAKDGIGAVSFDASAKKVTAVQSTVTVYQTPDGRYSLSASGNEVAFTAYAPGTPGTFPARVNENGTVTLPAGKRLLTNPNFAVGRVIYNELTGTVAPTGTRKLLEVIAPTGDEFGSHRLVGVTTSYAKAEELVASAPNAFVSGYGWTVPAEAQALWVVNEAPQGAQDDPNDFPDLGVIGNYLSKFNLDTVNWQASQRADVAVSGRSRSISFDDSRNTAYMPRTSFRTFAAKSAGPTVQNVATIPDDRLAAVVYEKTGEVFHLTSSVYGRRVFVYDSETGQVWDFIPATGTVPNTDLSGDQVLQGAIFGDLFVRVIGMNENGVANSLTKTRIEMYDIPTRTQRASYIINKKLANSGQIFGLRPEISLDPRANVLWIASQYEGSLGYLDLNTGTYTAVPISQEQGIAVGATDVEVDTSRNKLYVSIAKFRPSWLGASTPYVDGALWELDPASKQVERQVALQVYPWSVAILPTRDGTFVAVTNSATVSGNGTTVSSTLSIVDSGTFSEVARLQTQNQPTVTAVDLKD